MSPKRILNVDVSNCPSVQNRLKDFIKEEPVSNFMLNRFLYRGGLIGKIQPTRFLNNQVLRRGFLLYQKISVNF